MASSIVPSVSRLATAWDTTGNPRERTSSLRKGGMPFAQVMMILLLFILFSPGASFGADLAISAVALVFSTAGLNFTVKAAFAFSGAPAAGDGGTFMVAFSAGAGGLADGPSFHPRSTGTKTFGGPQMFEGHSGKKKDFHYFFLGASLAGFAALAPLSTSTDAAFIV